MTGTLTNDTILMEFPTAQMIHEDQQDPEGNYAIPTKTMSY